MIIIATYTDATEAYAAKNVLEENGIHCQLQGELLSEEPPEADKIDLLVEAHDADNARDILANAMGEDNSSH